MSKTKSFIQHLKQDHQSTQSTIDVIRDLNRAERELRHAQEDFEHERVHGPRSPGEKAKLGLKRLGEPLADEVGYIGIWLRKILLVMFFNFVAVMGFFWLLSLL